MASSGIHLASIECAIMVLENGRRIGRRIGERGKKSRYVLFVFRVLFPVNKGSLILTGETQDEVPLLLADPADTQS